ncbi:MAG: hypothetical protein ABSH16_11305 [Sedimentisphaerales bacterium]
MGIQDISENVILADVTAEPSLNEELKNVTEVEAAKAAPRLQSSAGFVLCLQGDKIDFFRYCARRRFRYG